MKNEHLDRFVTVRQGAFLPHWTLKDAIYHVVFRLCDSLPAHVVDQFRRERAALLAECGENPSKDVQTRLEYLFSERIERFLDEGLGECWLSREEIAVVVADALRHFDRIRYELHAWCVMPNHVHAVVRPFASESLEAILHSWKSFTGTKANRMLGRTGPFWQRESYDHIVRDAADLERTVRYVQDNPTKARLKNWIWVWPVSTDLRLEAAATPSPPRT